MGNWYNADPSLAGPIPFLNLSEPSLKAWNVLNVSKQKEWAQGHSLSTELSSNLKISHLEIKWDGRNTGFCLVCVFQKVISPIQVVKQAFTGMLSHCKLLNQSKAVKYYPQTAILQLNRDINQHDCCKYHTRLRHWLIPPASLPNHWLPQALYCINYPETLAFFVVPVWLEESKGYFCMLLKQRVKLCAVSCDQQKIPEYCLLVGGAEEQEVTHYW